MDRDGPALGVGGFPGRGDVRDDLPAVTAKVGGEFVAGEEQLRALRSRHRRMQVKRMVSDDQQRAPVGHGRREPGIHRPAFPGREMQVLRVHQVERSLGRLPFEQVFALPGIGQLTLNAVTQHDIPMIQGAVIFMAVVVLVVNFITDAIYVVLNPKLRHQ